MRPEPASGFVANFIDPAFNDCLFMWDSCFMVMFGRYGARAFPFVRTLDNLYAKQHPDGFICREIGRADGADRFFRYDPDSTGPNVLGWTEWEHYRNFGDRERLARVFPVLRAYHQWLRAFRTWPDGSYFSSGWGCGMDNQPRLRPRPAVLQPRALARLDDVGRHHAAAGALGAAAGADGAGARLRGRRGGHARGARAPLALRERPAVGRDGRLLLRPLERRAAERRQDDRRVLGADRGRRAEPSASTASSRTSTTRARSTGRTASRRSPPTRPSTTRRAATGAAACGPTRTTWCCAASRRSAATGSRTRSRATTSPTSSRSSRRSGTLWENYAPESASAGDPARRDFVGPGGLPPIGVLLEYVLGLRPDAPARRLVWDVRLTERHGVKRYPFGRRRLTRPVLRSASLARRAPADRGEARRAPIELELRWGGRSDVVRIGRG